MQSGKDHPNENNCLGVSKRVRLWYKCEYSWNSDNSVPIGDMDLFEEVQRIRA